jgi:hypothetical protein
MDVDEARHPNRLACIGVVMSSPFQRGVFTTISWLHPEPLAYPLEGKKCARYVVRGVR